MGRSPTNNEKGLKKGPWTPEEDEKLVQYIQKNGHGTWKPLPKLAGLNRCGKSCRLRWANYLRPDIKRGKFSQEEEQTILNLHSFLGNKWSVIATHLPGRTDNEIKNFWNTHLRKKLIQIGLDPTTHRPTTDIFSGLSNLIASVMDRNEQAVRLQAEAALWSRLQYVQYLLQPSSSVPIGSNNLASNILNAMNDHQLPSLSMHLDNSISMSHLQDLQLQGPCNFPTSMSSEFGQGNNSAVYSQAEATPTSPWVQTSSLDHALPSFTPNSINNSGDTCSASNYGGADSFWHELLLEDSFMT